MAISILQREAEKERKQKEQEKSSSTSSTTSILQREAQKERERAKAERAERNRINGVNSPNRGSSAPTTPPTTSRNNEQTAATERNEEKTTQTAPVTEANGNRVESAYSVARGNDYLQRAKDANARTIATAKAAEGNPSGYVSVADLRMGKDVTAGDTVEQLNTTLQDLQRKRADTSRRIAGMQRGNVRKEYLDPVVAELAEIDSQISETKRKIEEAKLPSYISRNEQIGLERKPMEDELASLRSYVGGYAGEAGGRKLASSGVAEVAKFRAAHERIAELEKELGYLDQETDMYERLSTYGEKKYEDNFGGQFSANVRLGDTAYRANEAANKALNTGDQRDWEYAAALAELEERLKGNNMNVYDDEGAVLPWLSKSAAGYLPQLSRQTVASVTGGIPGAAVGFFMGSPLKGYAVGAGLTSGAESYGQMRGAAYRALIEAGVDEETARAAANDEALLSALIEGLDTASDVLLVGGFGAAKSAIGAAVTKAAATPGASATVKGLAKYFSTQATKKAAKAQVKGVSKGIFKQAVSGGLRIGLNAGQEVIEESTQEGLSIANINRAQQGSTGKLNLVAETYKLFGDVIAGRDDESKEQILTAGKEGGIIALLFGGVGIAKNTAVTAALNQYTAVKTGKEYRGSVDRVIEDGLKRDKDTTAHKQATKLAEKVKAGKEISDAEIGRLVYANQLAAFEAEIDMIKDDPEMLDALIEEGKESGKGSVSEKIATEIEDKRQRGDEVSTYDVERLIAANDVYIQAEEANADPLMETAREAVGAVPDEVEQTPVPEQKPVEAAQNAGNDFFSAIENWTGYGKHGTQEFAKIVEQMNADPKKVRRSFQPAYEAGLADLPRSQINLLDSVQAQAYNAGLQDKILLEAKDSKAGEAVVRKDAGFVYDTLPADVTPAQAKAVDMLAKATGVRVQIVSGLATNASIREDGTVLIADDFEREVNGNKRSIVFYAAHEIGMHRLMQLAPNEGRAFINALIADRNKNLPYGAKTETEQKHEDYAKQNVSLTIEKAMEEVSADAVLGLYENEEEFFAAIDRIMNGTDEQAKQGARTFKQFLDDIIRSLKQILAKLTGKERAQAQETLNEVMSLRDLYERALEAAVNKAKSQTATTQTEVRTEVETTAQTEAKTETTESKQDVSRETESKPVEKEDDSKPVGKKPVTTSSTAFDGTGLTDDELKTAEKVMRDLRAEARIRKDSPVSYASYTAEQLEAAIERFSGDGLDDTSAYITWVNPSDILEAMVPSLRKRDRMVSNATENPFFDNDIDPIYLHAYVGSHDIEFKKDKSVARLMAELMENGVTRVAVIVVDRNGVGVASAKSDMIVGDIMRPSVFDVEGMLPLSKRYADAVQMLFGDADGGAQFDVKSPAVDVGNEGASFEDGGVQYSIRSLKHDITEGRMFDDLVRAKVFTQKEADLLKTNLDKLISYMVPNAHILDMNEPYTKTNRPYSAYKPNSDPLYKISLDFSTLCRKRLMTQYVIEQLQLRENRPMSAEEQMAIRSMLLEYRQHEKALKVACAMCYVEAARLKSPKQMERFFAETESIMRKYFAKKDSEFNAKVIEAQKKFKRDHGYDEDIPAKNMKQKDKTAMDKMTARMRMAYIPNAEQQAIIETAVKLPRSSFLTAANLTALAIDHPEIYDAYTSHIRSATRSKSLESDIPYYYGDSRGAVSDKFIDNVNAENGMRFDSWSDFQMKHMLDMITAVIDLSVRKSKMHGYTKFPEMVRIFGKTGMMFNLSGVADGNGLDANGNLLFSNTESINFEEAIELREQFPETAGMQCIGVSDDHIRALLRSEFIDYVIPYHTSGMNATLRRMAGIYEWANYTNTQHARKDPKAKKPANAENWQVEPVWSEFFVNEGKDGYEAMRNTAKRYVEMCRERGLIPKFDQFLDEDGYWKLLIDRKMVNQQSGELIEQKAVKPIFDFDLIQQEIDREVSEYDPSLEQRALKYVVENFDAVSQRIKDLKKRHPKKSMMNMGNEVYQAYAEGSKRSDGTQHSLREGISTEQAEFSDADVQYSIREKAPPKKVGIAYKVFYAKNGQLYPPMVANPGGAGTPVGVWLDADVAAAAAPSKTGRPQVQAGGKGTNASKMSLAFRPGWHLGDLPIATQFARKNPESGKKELFPADFVWAECEYAMDKDYQDEAMSYGYTESGKFRHAYAGLPRLPEDGYYRYRTNPDPNTIPWVITGAMRVKRILNDAETDAILRDAGVEPMARQGGPVDLAELGLKEGMQYSLREQNNLMAENARLREVNEALRAQFKVTKLPTVDEKSLGKFTRTLLKDWSSEADFDETRGALSEFYTFIQTEMDKDEPNLAEMEKRAFELATDILVQASEVDDEAYLEFKEMRDTIRTTGITLAAQDASDLRDYEGLEDFRRRNFGRIKLVKNGLPVDSFYQELASAYPAFFDAEMYTHPAEQLSHIAEVLDSLKPAEVNPYQGEMREAATWLATDIMHRIYELPQAKPTFADKAQQKLTEQKAKDAEKLATLREQKNARIAQIIANARDRMRSMQRSERAKRETAVKQVKAHYAEKEARASERRKAQILRAQIVRHTEQMSRKLLKATDKNHVPAGLIPAVAKLLSCINLESAYTYDPATDSYKKSDAGLPSRRTEEFRKVKELYEEIAANNEYGMVLDPNLLGVPAEGIKSMLDKVIAMQDVRLVDMNMEQLQTVYDVLRTMEHSIVKAGKTFTRMRWSDIHEMSDSFMEDTATRRTKTSKSQYLLDIETPYTFFSHFGEAGHAFYRMLREAQDSEQRMQDTLVERMQEVVSQEVRKKAEKEVVEFTTQRGEKLTLSRAHMMEIYLLNNRPQARQHLLGGGIIQPEVGKIRKGTESVLLTEMDVADIIRKLTPEERKVADGLQKITLLLAEWGNQASMTVYGYKKFNDPNYWTIKSSKFGVRQNVEQGQNKPRSIGNMGSAKNTIPEANNALDIAGVFNTFDQHAADMLCYSAWLAPMEDAERLFNYTFRDANWQPTNKTMKGIIDRVAGEGGTQYWLRLVEDIQNGLSAPVDTATEGIVMKAIGNTKRAAIAANLRVVIQQPTAYGRAAAVLDPGVMLAAIGKDFAVKPAIDGWHKAVKYAPIAARKATGGFEVASNPKGLAELMYQPETKMGKVKAFTKEAGLWLPGKADQVTWGTIWNACELQVKKNNKALRADSESFYDAVKELFTEVIDQTQVVDGVLQRSQAMRSGSAFVKQMTSFTGEPTQGANMVIRAYDKVRYETDPKKRSKAKKVLGRAVTAYCVTAVLNAFAQSLVDAFRDDDDEDDYWAKVWKRFGGIGGDEKTWWDYTRNILLAGNISNNLNPLTWLPVWKDVLSIVQGYSVERMDAGTFDDFMTAVGNTIKSMTGDGKHTIGYATLRTLLIGGKLRGFGGYNFLRDIEGAVRTVQVESGNLRAIYDTERLLTQPKNNKSRYMDILFKAYQDDSDAYEYIISDMLKGDYFKSDKKTTQEYIMSAMDARLAKAQGVEKVSELDQRFLFPDQQKAYDSRMSALTNNRLWNNATKEQRQDVKADLYGIVTESEGSESMRAKIAEGKEYGLDDGEYLLFRLALDMYDKPTDKGKYGSYTSAEKAAALLAADLGDEETAYLWDSEEALKALAAGVDMDNYVDFKGRLSSLKSGVDYKKGDSDSRKRAIRALLRDMGLSSNSYDYKWLWRTEYK